jgi:DnaJ-class molecular chaperone
MSSSSDFALLGVPVGADEAALRQAFLQAVKAARPDRGGDPERYRLVIAAYRRLRRPTSQGELDVRLELTVTAEQASAGGHKLVRLPTGRTVRVTLPAGLRDGRVLRLRHQGFNAPGRWGDAYLTVVVAQPSRAAQRAAEILRPSASVLLRRFAGTWAA